MRSKISWKSLQPLHARCLTLGCVQTSAFLSGNPAHCPSVEALCHVLLELFYYEGKTIITKNSKPVFYLETGFGQ